MRLAEAEGVGRGVLSEALARTEIMPAWTLGKLERLAAGDLKPAFSLELAVKDLRLIEETAREGALALPLPDAVRERYVEALAAGLGSQDFSAVDLAVAGSD